MIAAGLDPESGPLRIYNWNGYLDPKIKKGFGKEYGVDVEETFFSTTDEAVAKIASGRSSSTSSSRRRIASAGSSSESVSSR